MNTDLWMIDDQRILDRRLGVWWTYADGRLTFTSIDGVLRMEIIIDAAGVWKFLIANALDVRKGY